MPDQHRIVGLTLVGGPVGGWFLVVNRTPCGDDTTDVADPDPDPPTSEPDSTEDEPDSVDESDLTAEPDDAPVELTASFRGATEDVIRVGVVAIDFDRLAAAGVQINSGDAGAIRLDQIFCYTELNDITVIAVSQQNQERNDRSNAPYVTVRGRTDTRSAAWADAMVDAGVFEGETVCVFGLVDADEELYNETVAALRAVGIEPVDGLVASNGGDVVANRAASEIIFEKLRSEGVTVTVHVSPVADGLEIAGSIGYETKHRLRDEMGPEPGDRVWITDGRRRRPLLCRRHADAHAHPGRHGRSAGHG